MIVIDQLYGAFEVDAKFESLLLTPEVQRLREIRLINITTPSLGALSDARRYTHTLGVYFLSKRLVQRFGTDLSMAEIEALQASALLHDIATAPFGHLFEYLLSAEDPQWHHEHFIEQIFIGQAHWGRTHFQLYRGQTTMIREELDKAQIDRKMVYSIVRGQDPKLSPLLAGQLDIDNLDNVIRMATLLGLRPDPDLPLKIIDAYADLPIGGLPVFTPEAIPLVETWMKIRKQVYEILAFDEVTLSGQAMLSECILYALKNGLISNEEWFLTDEELVSRLWKINPKRKTMKRFSNGDVYRPVFIGWYDVPKDPVYDYRTWIGRKTLESFLATGHWEPVDQREDQLSPNKPANLDGPYSAYVFYDKGSFSKRLRFYVKGEDGYVLKDLGESSKSTIISVFARQPRLSPGEARRQAKIIMDRLEALGFPRTSLKPIPSKEGVYDLWQARLPI